MAYPETGGTIPEDEKDPRMAAHTESHPEVDSQMETAGDANPASSEAQVIDVAALRKEGLTAGEEKTEKAPLPTVAEMGAADSTLEAEMSPHEQESMVGDINDGVNQFAESQEARAADAEKEADPLSRAREFFGKYKKEFDEAVRDVNALLDKEEFDEARKSARTFIEKMKAKAGKYFEGKIDDWFSEYDDLTQQADGASQSTKKERLLKLAMEGVDFIPVVGPMKMLAESAAGRTLSGAKLTKFKRMFHAMEGATFLALDLTGVGAVAKGANASKLITRSSALMRKMGVARKAYMPIFKFGKFISRHPALAKVADKVIKYTILRRKKRKTAFVKSIPGIVLSDQEAGRMAA